MEPASPHTEMDDSQDTPIADTSSVQWPLEVPTTVVLLCTQRTRLFSLIKEKHATTGDQVEDTAVSIPELREAFYELIEAHCICIKRLSDKLLTPPTWNLRMTGRQGRRASSWPPPLAATASQMGIQPPSPKSHPAAGHKPCVLPPRRTSSWKDTMQHWSTDSDTSSSENRFVSSGGRV